MNLMTLAQARAVKDLKRHHKRDVVVRRRAPMGELSVFADVQPERGDRWDPFTYRILANGTVCE